MVSTLKTIKRVSVNSTIKNAFILFAYIVFVHYLFIFVYKKTFLYSYDSKLFIYCFHGGKYLFCLAETLIVAWFSLRRISANGLVDKAMFFLNMLYFLPGFVQQAATNSDWQFIIYYFLFWLFCEIWASVIKPFSRIREGISYYPAVSDGLLYALSFFSAAFAVSLAFYLHTSFSLESFRYALENIYEVRQGGKNASIHWIILSVEYWSAYFMIIMMGYFSEKRKWWMVCILLCAEGILFLIQANRIFLFLSAAAIAFGSIRINNKKLVWCFALLGVLLIVDSALIEKGSLFTDAFRRFSIVPNRMSEVYFDFFQTHEPDFLRSKYVRIARFLSLESPYESTSVSMIIGSTYFRDGMNANNGLVGAAVFGFGKAGFVLSSFGLVFGLRLFERATTHFRDSNLIDIVAFTLISLVINAPYFLANILSISFYLFLLLSLILTNCVYANGERTEGNTP